MSVLDELEVSLGEISKGHLIEEYSNIGSNAAITSPEQGKDLFRAFFWKKNYDVINFD